MGIMSLLKYRLEKSDISIEKVIFLSHISYKTNFMWVKNIKIQGETEKKSYRKYHKITESFTKFQGREKLANMIGAEHQVGWALVYLKFQNGKANRT